VAQTGARGSAVKESPFEVRRSGEAIGGLLWTNGDWREPHPLVLAGHGFGQDKRRLYPATLPEDLVLGHGIAVAAVDAPHHGDRRSVAAGDEQFAAEWRAHWRLHGSSQIAAELRAVVELLEQRQEIDTERTGYWGLSLATQYGLGYLATGPVIRAAVIGLFGMPDPAPRLAGYARRVTCPVLFLRQLDDLVHDADRVRTLFEAIASEDKALRDNPGRHTEVPRSEFVTAYQWLSARLNA
jgi:dienelactone hydrolase